MKTHGRWYVQARFRSERYTQPDWVTYSSHAGKIHLKNLKGESYA